MSQVEFNQLIALQCYAFEQGNLKRICTHFNQFLGTISPDALESKNPALYCAFITEWLKFSSLTCRYNRFSFGQSVSCDLEVETACHKVYALDFKVVSNQTPQMLDKINQTVLDPGKEQMLAHGYAQELFSGGSRNLTCMVLAIDTEQQRIVACRCFDQERDEYFWVD